MKVYNSMETARRIKEAINDKGITSAELSRLSGVSKASVSQYTVGRCAPNNLTAGKLSQVLGVSPMWLMGFDAPKTRELFEKQVADPTDIALLTFYYNKLDNSDKRTIMNLAIRLAENSKGEQ